MIRRRAPNLLRRVSTVLLVAVLLLLALLVINRSRVLAEEERRSEALEARADLGTIVNLWERLVTDRITTWLLDLPKSPDPALREQQIRSKVSWFDAFYAWDATAAGPAFQYPAPAPEEDLKRLLAGACMREAHGHAVMGERGQAAAAFLECRDGTAAERLLASNMAARQYQELDQPQSAWDALSSFDPPIDTPLTSARAAGLSLQRLTTRRLLGGEVLLALGQRSRAADLLLDTFQQITTLSGPDLEATLPAAERLARVELADLLTEEEHAALDAPLSRARRRLAGYHEIRDRIGTLGNGGITPTGPQLPGLSERPRVMHDLYSDPGFILVWAQIDERTVTAVHLDARDLLQNLQDAERAEAGMDRRIVILDGGGRPVLGMDLDPDLVALADAPLGWLFPHLRLALLATPRDEGQQVFWSVLAQLLPLGVALVLGVVGIAVQQAANRRERELFARQTDFMARVTHELKTPLAGIRVMAETLQMGAKDDPQTTDRFLERIIHESENLGNRIDEVLTAARQPEVSEKTPIRPEELAAEVVETWKPRFQQAGATLETDLRPCHPIPADPPLLRDALGNLLDNALKYQRPGVRGKVLVRTAQTSRWVIIEVVDNGLGVPIPMRRQIFERFARVEGPGRGKAGGHGLGLSFVADTAAAHRGMVECTDGFDGGARFRIKLRRRRR